MKFSKLTLLLLSFVAMGLSATTASAQSATNLNALRGLASVTTLSSSEAGKSALARNLTNTGLIQAGTAHQPTLLPFHKQQEQAIRDTFIASNNANDLADALGSKLGGIYQAGTHYTSTDDGKTVDVANKISPAVTRLMTYASALTSSDAGSGKFFFANATTNGKDPVSPDALAILKDVNGSADVFGQAYIKPAGSEGADKFGNSRPFQTEPKLTLFEGKDFFDVASTNGVYLYGPKQDLTNSPSFPSGHTTYGYTEALLLAILVPQRYPEMVARAAEYGNDRIIMGAHYTMDVLGGRTLTTYDIAQLLANKPDYVGVKRADIEIDDFQKALTDARAELDQAFKAACHQSVASCARHDVSRFSRPSRNRAFYESTQTYGLPIVFEKNAKGKEDVGKLAPEAGYLLTSAFPYLTLSQANAILTATEGPGGGFLDDGSAFGVYSRLDLYRAAQKAIALAPKR